MNSSTQLAQGHCRLRLVAAGGAAVAVAFLTSACTGSAADSPATESTATHSAHEPSRSADASENQGRNATDGRASEVQTITVTDDGFQPASLSVPVGTRVTVVNEGATNHTWTDDGAGIDSGTLRPGEEFSFTFTEAGSYDFVCLLHPTMTASVTVE